MPSALAKFDALGNRIASSEDWDMCRAKITRLYWIENRSLREVMDIMSREHSLRATCKMYKNRIAQWGLVKNHKEADMLAILLKKRERDAMGKSSRFLVRGKPVAMEEVYHYFKRKGVNPDQITIGETYSSVAQSDVSFRTPSPEPQLSGSSIDLRPNNNFQLQLDSANQIPPCLILPQTITHEHLLFAVKAHIVSGFKTKRWYFDLEENYFNICKSDSDEASVFYQSCKTAMELVRMESFVEARLALNKACSMIPSILKGSNPRALERCLDTVLFLQQYGQPRIMSLVSQYISNMALTLQNSAPYWDQIFGLISTLDSEHIESAVNQCWKCIIDTLETHLGPFSNESLESFLKHTSRLYRGRRLEEGERLLRRKYLESGDSVGYSSTQSLRILIQVGWSVLGQNRCTEAEDIAVAVIDSSQQNGYFVGEIKGLKLYARAQRAMQKTYLAEQNLRKALAMIKQQWGPSAPWYLDLIIDLEQWLQEWGFYKEADKLREESGRVLQAYNDL